MTDTQLIERLTHCSQNTKDEYLHELTGRAAAALTDAEAKLVKARDGFHKIADLGSDGEHSGDRHARCRDYAWACLAELENG